ncbi:hypothetical protein H1230_06950 [Paenibacillus sp. 19GGS1-52]|uniref:hypothetical protein n=1 Tax=Paenibacillus sp. 19GGS1-52 TaxID=2758563 RepID=UPI001EFA706A|nr:hypothetical protein [Paenibacillus sp. 19GGS1-52]ULO08538.1 hypothetical protein H1230_06950 [Paenibacillus sp. 19GGS1-52]
MNRTEIEEAIKDICGKIILSLRGNQGEDGNALIDAELIESLHRNLENYKEVIANEKMVSKDVVSLVFYTCGRFQSQSNYSKNSIELLREFERLYFKIQMTFSIEGL